MSIKSKFQNWFYLDDEEEEEIQPERQREDATSGERPGETAVKTRKQQHRQTAVDDAAVR